MVCGLLNGSAVVRSSCGAVRGRAVFASAVVVTSLAAQRLLCADYNGDVRVYALDGSADDLQTEVGLAASPTPLSFENIMRPQ